MAANPRALGQVAAYRDPVPLGGTTAASPTETPHDLTRDHDGVNPANYIVVCNTGATNALLVRFTTASAATISIPPGITMPLPISAKAIYVSAAAATTTYSLLPAWERYLS